MTESFRWHPEGRLFDARGEVKPQPPTGPVAEDSASGLARVIGLPAFRLGALEEPPPDLGKEPVFETLTSGSTGKPRRIRRTQASWTASFAVSATLGIGPGARVAVLGRLIHSLSLYAALEGLHLGAEVHILESLRPDRQRRALADRHITHLYATPAQLRLLTEAPGKCPALRLILVGGSKLDPALRATLTTRAPNARVREFYGAAETSFITLADETTPEASVGRPYPGVEIALDPTGEVWVKSPYLFLGYATPAHTATDPALPSPRVGEGEGGGAPAGHPPTPNPSPPGGGEAHAPDQPTHPTPLGGEGRGEGTHGTKWRNGWLSVGEIGWMEGGHLYLKGRAGRMVTVADQNVFPEEIEAQMEALPGLRRAAVLPVPDQSRGTILIALVQGDRSAEPAILKALRNRLGPLKAPRALIWLEDWPVLPSGKTDLKALEAALKWPA